MDDFARKNQSDEKIMYYYKKLIPFVYSHGLFSVLGLFKRIMINVLGLFKPMPRGPFSNTEVETVAVKSTALACQNIMNAISAQGYDSCPMEGFDESRVKKLLNLSSKSKVVMVIACGKGDPSGIYGERVRFARSNFIHHC